MRVFHFPPLHVHFACYLNLFYFDRVNENKIEPFKLLYPRKGQIVYLENMPVNGGRNRTLLRSGCVPRVISYKYTLI